MFHDVAAHDDVGAGIGEGQLLAAGRDHRTAAGAPLGVHIDVEPDIASARRREGVGELHRTAADVDHRGPIQAGVFEDLLNGVRSQIAVEDIRFGLLFEE